MYQKTYSRDVPVLRCFNDLIKVSSSKLQLLLNCFLFKKIENGCLLGYFVALNIDSFGIHKQLTPSTQPRTELFCSFVISSCFMVSSHFCFNYFTKRYFSDVCTCVDIYKLLILVKISLEVSTTLQLDSS